MLNKIGIIGVGYVGRAIHDCYVGKNFDVITVDVDPDKSTGTYEDLMDCDGIFVCVPSPNKEDGSCDTKILNSVLFLLSDYKNVIISKTTAPPDFYEKMQMIYPNLVHVPEFLTAANALDDFSQQRIAIIGGSVPAYCREALRILMMAQPIENSSYVSIGEAALIKYIINSFLATKVVFMNEMAGIAESYGYDWSKISKSLELDSRLGSSHMQVPGPDGYYGFGGACFPKDTAAAVSFAKKKKIDLAVLKTAIKKNLLLRLQKPK